MMTNPARKGLFALPCMLALPLAVLFSVLPATAQEGLGALETRQAVSTGKYQDIVRAMALTEERLARLRAEVDSVKKDSAALTTALIQAAKTERKLGEDIDLIAGRLDVLGGQEEAIRGSLAARRGVLMEVLGALQRMGLNPPPALLVQPEDALASVRSAILLGAVVPELRAETEVLVADLRELSRVTASIEAERERLGEKIAEQEAEKERLSLLLDEKKKLQAEAEARMADERRRAEELASRAGSLEELIASLESEIVSLREAEEERRRAALRKIPEENRLGVSLPFSERRGRLAVPVAGEFGPRFGEDDGVGGAVKGDILRTQSGAIVTAPADGTVLYAGPFRSYGQLLILNAGDGYHIVLAGLDRIGVSLGQSVLAGEPLGAMGESRLASVAGLEDGSAAPELYVEFRKEGVPVDPAAWWSEDLSGRTGNDT